MGTLQVVFASNPQPGKWKPSASPTVKTSLQSQDKSSKVKRKVGSRMKASPKQIAWRKKFGRMQKAKAKANRAKKRGKKQNPYKLVAKKGRRTINAGSFLSKKEMKGLTRKSYKFEEALGRGNFRKRSKATRAVKRATGAIKRVLKASPKARRKAVSRAAALRKKGYKVKKVYISPKSVLASATKAVRRKKRKGGNRKHSRKESKVAKRRRKKKSGSKRRKSRKARARKAPRRRRATRRRKARRGRGKVIVLKRKNQRVTIRRNPNLKAALEQYTGFQVEELGSLLVGGAIYGTVDGLAAKYAPGVYAMAAKIPVVGTTVVPAVIGIALNYAGKKFGVKPLSLLGEGIVGAAVVAMGIQASQYLPGIAPHAAQAGYGNVDFTPGRGVMMGGYARDGADFGNVDFTPGPGVMMGAQAQLGMNAQMGDSGQRDGADFGLIPEGLGLVPEGLGGLG